MILQIDQAHLLIMGAMMWFPNIELSTMKLQYYYFIHLVTSFSHLQDATIFTGRPKNARTVWYRCKPLHSLRMTIAFPVR